MTGRFSWPTVVVALAVATAGWLAGRLLDAGPAATLAAVCAVFLTVGATGGSLRADLRLLATVGPAFVAAMTVPRLLASLNAAAALLALATLILVAGLLPARGPRWRTVGKGLALTTLMSYGMPLGEPTSAGQLLAAAVAALAAVTALRVALAGGDPGGPVRRKVAAVLTMPVPDVAGALVAWIQDRPKVWLGDALAAAAAYRALRTAEPSSDERRAILDASAVQVAALISAREPPQVSDAAPTDDGDSAVQALRRAAAAATTRGPALAPIPPRSRRRLVAAVWASPLTWGSEQLRHAVRSSLAVLTAALLALAVLPPGTAVVSTLLMATYGVLQTSWSRTLERAWQRVVGVAVGGAVALGAVWLLPTEVLGPLALAGLVVGIGSVAAAPPASYAGFVVATLGVNVGLRHLDPEASLGGYLLWVGVALLIGVVFAFTVVPGIRRRDIIARRDEAREALTAALEGFALGSSDPAADLGRAQRAMRATSELTAPPARRQVLPSPDPSGVRHLVDSATALVALAGMLALGRDSGSQVALDLATAVLRGEREPPVDAAPGLAGLTVGLAGEVARGLDALG